MVNNLRVAFTAILVRKLRFSLFDFDKWIEINEKDDKISSS